MKKFTLISLMMLLTLLGVKEAQVLTFLSAAKALVLHLELLPLKVISFMPTLLRPQYGSMARRNGHT